MMPTASISRRETATNGDSFTSMCATSMSPKNQGLDGATDSTSFQGLTADGRAGFIRVTQFDEKQLKKRAQEKERKVKVPK